MPGTFGKNCKEKCLPGWYGVKCTMKCTCNSHQNCDPARGCVCLPGYNGVNCSNGTCTFKIEHIRLYGLYIISINVISSFSFDFELVTILGIFFSFFTRVFLTIFLAKTTFEPF